MHVDISKLDQQLAFLQREVTRLHEMDTPWASRNAMMLDGIAETLRCLRQEQQMTGMDGKRIG